MKQKPNVIFLFSDQQRYDTVSCYGKAPGGTLKLTPNLDKLAADGTRFDMNFTCQPVCGPARACIQTGVYPSLIGCNVNDRALPHDTKTIADYFNDAGYETSYVGKWHLASHRSFGKEGRDLKTLPVPPEYRGGYKDFWVAADVLEFTSHGEGGYMYDTNMNKREFSHYRADATTDFALEYLCGAGEKPFFLFVSWIEPHHQNDRNRYEGPDGSKERFSDYEIPKDLIDTAGDWRENMPDYLGCCKSLDDNVGHFVALLKDKGIFDNTVIIYTSDHGSHFRTRNKEYKRSCHDATLRTPMIAHGPGFCGGKVVAQLTSLLDLAPTLLTCANIERPPQMKGIPLQQLSEDPSVPIHDEIYVQISESCVGRAIRTNRFTYCVEADKSVPLEAPSALVYYERYLYDNDADPYQRSNLIDDENSAEIRLNLRQRLISIIELEERERPDILYRA